MVDRTTSKEREAKGRIRVRQGSMTRVDLDEEVQRPQHLDSLIG